MSDEPNEVADFEEDSSQQPVKKGFLSPFIIKVLQLVALGIGIIILVVVTNIIYGAISQQKGGSTGPTTNVPFRKKAVPLDVLEIEEPFRQKLSDGKMIQLKLSLGFKEKNKKLQTELSRIKPEIIDTIVRQLSKMSSKDFNNKGGSSLDKLEETLLKHINRILSSGRVEKIFFQQFTLMD